MKLLATLLLALCAPFAALAQGVPYEFYFTQTLPSGVGFFGRYVPPPAPAPNTSAVFMYDGTSTLPKLGVIGSGLSWNGTTLSTTATAQVNSDWTASSGVAQVLNKPSLATVATSGSYADLSGTPPPLQRTRAQTNTSGVLTWTFPIAYGGGVIPVVSLTVEDATAGVTWNEQITSISNTSVSIQLTKTTVVSILGVSVLGTAATPQAFVHMTAIAP